LIKKNEVLVPNTRAGGITHPPIDELLDVAKSKYQLVIYAAKRARQINAYYSQLGEGLLEYVGPLVETQLQEKSLSIALREINAGLLTAEAVDPEVLAAEQLAMEQRRLAMHQEAAQYGNEYDSSFEAEVAPQGETEVSEPVETDPFTA
jgi:DNA-directed RNA polymerase subunit omega